MKLTTLAVPFLCAAALTGQDKPDPAKVLPRQIILPVSFNKEPLKDKDRPRVMFEMGRMTPIIDARTGGFRLATDNNLDRRVLPAIDAHPGALAMKGAGIVHLMRCESFTGDVKTEFINRVEKLSADAIIANRKTLEIQISANNPDNIKQDEKLQKNADKDIVQIEKDREVSIKAINAAYSGCQAALSARTPK